MCGIAAAFGRPLPASNDIVRRTLAALQHRGDQPPAMQAVKDGVLGCARLEITGGPMGAQPMRSRDGRITVIFNGEIYNWRALRSSLESDTPFRTECDTEVLLHGYERWGHDLPGRLEGMFAFVIHDASSGEVFAARDSSGIKPLYLAKLRGGGMAFSSEIRALVEHADEIEPVPPGCAYMHGRLAPWPLRAQNDTRPADPDDAAGQFRDLLRASIEARCPPELPIAVYCSGGIDSSAVLLETARAAPGRTHAFCVGTDEAEDLGYARAVAAQVGVPLHVVSITTDDMLALVPETIRTIESFEPNHIRAGTANLALARAVGLQGFKVALVGEGADEILGGYEEFRLAATEKDLNELFDRFAAELHRTQLQRVDRVNMRYAIEARVPYLDERLVRFVSRLPREFLVRPVSAGDRPTGKWILRHAYADDLGSVAWRRKVPMGEGAGIGDNAPTGPFVEHANAHFDDASFRRIRDDYPEWHLRTREEAYYFSMFLLEFGPLRMTQSRPMTNLARTTA